jgi:gamma-glutamylputrescine oxidase
MSERRYPYDEISPWVSAPADLQPPLDRDLRVDVAVVGGGYTGLSTALALRAAGTDVALIEQDFAGSGASGRNAGHLTPTIGKDLPTLLRMFGRKRAEALVRFADDAVGYTEKVIEDAAIDCEYVASGNVLGGVHPKQEPRLRKAAETAAALGGHVRFLASDQMRERGLPPAFSFGVLEERGGTLHPGRYVMGLRRAAIDAGVKMFERSPVTAVRDGVAPRVRTGGGTVTADRVVLATNAYTGRIGWKRRAVAPLRVALFETEPLPEAVLARLGWRGREGIYTAHEILESYRLTIRGTIVGGSKIVRYAWNGGLAEGYDPGAFDVIERGFRARFPELAAVPVARFWGGWIGLTLDFLPMIGSTGAHGNVLYGFGYAGHGVAQATLMGAMLAERAAGRRHPSEPALARKERAWPPEPLLWLGAKLLNGTLSALDARTDRQIEALARTRR